MKYVIDTNIILFQTRNNDVWKYFKKKYFPKGVKGYGIISFATRAEIRAIANKLRWESNKKLRLEQFLKQLKVIHSKEQNLENFYIQIDNYSQNKHKSLSLPKGTTARNMGKNDIWIAATAALYDYSLISTDRDFEHLNGVFIDFIYIDVTQTRQSI